MQAFRPNIPAKHWSEIRPFVIEHVTALGPSQGRQANTALSMVTHYVHWVWQTAGLPVESAIFSRQLVELYLARALAGSCDGTLRKTRWQLTQFCSDVGDDEPTPFRRRGTKPPHRLPYTEIEQERLRAWAFQQSSAMLRQNASALVGLVGGAGLAVQDLQTLLVRDVILEGERTIVTMRGQRARVVSVDAAWAYLLQPALESLAPGDFVLRPGRRSTTNRGLASPILETCSTPPVPVNTLRLRNTWLTRHLAEDDDVRDFMAKAVLGPWGVYDWLPYVTTDDPDALRRRVASQLKGVWAKHPSTA